MLGSPIQVSEAVAALHRDALVIDLHNDVLTKLSHAPYDFSRRHGAAAFWNPFRLDLDLPKIRAAGIDALGCAMFAGFRVSAQRRFWRMIDQVRALEQAHPGDLVVARTAAEVRAAQAQGRVGLVLGVEGSYTVEDEMDARLDRLAAAGVRFLGPLWERDSGAGSSCRSRRDRGLTDAGRALVRGCTARGIVLDVAHASVQTFWDMADTTAAPLFSSHSGARAVDDHPRNLDDDQIREIARRGGVVGIIFVAAYLGSAFAPLARVADHIEHAVRVAGEDCVALGSDFDGFMPLVRGMRDAADLPRLTQVLWDRGWREPQLRKLLGGNALAFFERAWT